MGDFAFITDQDALDYIHEWAVNDEHYPLNHVAHLKIEAAYNQVSEQLARLEDLMH